MPRPDEECQDLGNACGFDPGTEEYYAIYLYNMRFEVPDQAPCMTVHYKFGKGSSAGSTMWPIIEDLVRNVYPSPLTHETCCGTRFADIARRRKGFVVFAIDFCDGSELKHAKMKYRKYILGHEEATYTFELHRSWSIDIADVDGEQKKVYIVSYFNHMHRKDGRGVPLGAETEEFQYEVRSKRSRVMLPDSGGKVGILDDGEYNEFDESGGTNTGPPVSPPARYR